MKLIELKLNNVGPFAGEVSIPLESTKGKPIVLIGGLNGRGKTTIIEALQLVLFGKHSNSARDGKSYAAYLCSLIHDQSDPLPNKASITLEFLRYGEGRFLIERSWEKKGGEESRILGERDNFRVWRKQTGETEWVESSRWKDNWYELFQKIIPWQVAEMFFIDGEKVKEYANPEKTQELIRSTISKLIGADMIDKLEKDLETLDREQKTEEAKKSGLLTEKEEEALKALEEKLEYKRNQAYSFSKACQSALTAVEESKEAALEVLANSRGEAENWELWKKLRREKEVELEKAETGLRDRLRVSHCSLYLLQDDLQDLLDECREESESRKNLEKLQFIDELQQSVEGAVEANDPSEEKYKKAVLVIFEAKRDELRQGYESEEIYQEV